MANHVDTYVSFNRISEAGQKRFAELCSRLDGWNTKGAYSFNMHEIFGLEESEDGPGTYSWNIENMGAKWCYMEDCGDDGFRTQSAWSVPFDGIQYILEEIYKVDHTLVATIVYEDEMPNFVGWATWNNECWDEGREWQWEEMQQHMLDEHEDLRAEWIEDDEDWTDTGRELAWDYTRDFIDEVVWGTLQEEVDYYFEHEHDDEEYTEGVRNEV
jgi:hypothetical protein